MNVARQGKSGLFNQDFFSNYEQIQHHQPGTGELANFDKDPDGKRNLSQKDIEKMRKEQQGLSQLFGGLNPYHFLYLLLLGSMGAALAWVLDSTVFFLNSHKIAWAHDESFNFWGRYACWISWHLCMMLICASIGEYISRDSEGSGVPEMKAVLAGVHLHKFLAINALVGKFFGIVCALAGGLSMGRQGAFVHMSCVISHQMATKIKQFKDIGSNYSLRLQMYGAAICVGTVATFGAPIGAVIFSMELTSTYYMVGNLWKSFLAAMAAIIVYHLLHAGVGYIPTPKHTEIKDINLNHEIIFFIILGFISAWVAGLFNHVLTKLIFLRVRLKNPYISNRWKWCVTVSLFISIIGFPIHYLHFSEKKICDMFFSIHDMETLKEGDTWGNPLQAFNLVVYCILKFFFIVLSISCPIPNGIFAPVFSLGAGIGKLYGHVLMKIGEYIGIRLVQSEALYAVVGAAAIGGTVTKTVSTVIIVFEMLGQVDQIIVPVMIGLMVGMWASQGISMGIFDVVIEFKNFPYMPVLGSVQAYSLKASDIMNHTFMYISKDCKLRDLPIILNKTQSCAVTIPVVKSEEDKTLLYTVSSTSLRQYLFEHYKIVSQLMDQRVKRNIDQYLYALTEVNDKNPPNKKEISVDPLIHQIYEDLNELSKTHQEIVENFWNSPVNFQDPSLQINHSPFLVMQDTPMSKIHFLFTMLNINLLIVLKKGVVKGIITKLEFIQKRKSPVIQAEQARRKKIKRNRAIEMGDRKL
eukprot:403360828